MFRSIVLALAFAFSTLFAVAQDSATPNKNLDISSPMGSLHLGADADARKIGLPLYPGARLKSQDDNSDQANLSLLTEAFGMKLVVANYVSGDDPAKILAFYRQKLKRYGKVLQCHSEEHGGDVSVHQDEHQSDSGKELKCEQNSGPVTELKAGTEDNQHIVAVEPAKGSPGSNFALVYVHTRGKMGDI